MTERDTAKRLSFQRMDARTRAAAHALLGDFLRADETYLAAADVYGDGGGEALQRALDLFLARPELGFVWLALDGAQPVGACVVCYAISTSRGSLVAKLDDVSIAAERRGAGIGTAMLAALAEHLRAAGLTRIDTAAHAENPGARRFYERLGYRSLREERMALLL